MVYLMQDKVKIIEYYFKNNERANTVSRMFNRINLKISANWIFGKWNCRIENLVRNKAVEVDVLGQVAMHPTLSTRKLAEISGENQSTVERILNAYRFHSYKSKLVQELHEDVIQDTNFLFYFCFSDECSFLMSTGLLIHIIVGNSHQVQTQHLEKLYVWVWRTCCWTILLPGNLTGDMYLELLEDAVDSTWSNLVENDNQYLEDHLTFQHYEVPPHFAAPLHQYLNERFPRHWIIEWPLGLLINPLWLILEPFEK